MSGFTGGATRGANTFTGAQAITDATASTNTSTGALTVTGGVGIGGALNIAGKMTGAVALGAAPGLDFSPSGATSVAAGASYTIVAASSGLLLVSDNTFSGSTAIFLLGAGSVSLLGQSAAGTWVVGSAPSATQWGVYYSAPNYFVKNGAASGSFFYGLLIQVRPAV